MLTGENFNYAERSMSQYHFVRNSSLIDWSNTDPRYSTVERPMANRPCAGTAENCEKFDFFVLG
jgi:hypothetical protein